MLFDMMNGKKIKSVPYERDYRQWLSRMSHAEIDQIKERLNGMVDGTEIQTAGWMPGADWNDTPFQPIYEKAARCNIELAAKCFGLMVWEMFLERPEKWTSGRFEKDGEPIGSRTYFRTP